MICIKKQENKNYKKTKKLLDFVFFLVYAESKRIKKKGDFYEKFLTSIIG